ncbi:hypothetical protein [Sphingopyxis sp.]|uniref:hypothetical protein n=1 Tax=Sphingopyxis sp. TaxID=1908224 RepID=UPI002FC76D46
MSRRPQPARFARLAMLEDLAALERRRTLESACAETDQHSAKAALLTQDLLAAEAGLEAIYAKDRLCLDSLRLAAWIVGDSEQALVRGKAALDRAQSDEREAGLEWMAARHRTEWFSNQARTLQKKEADRRDETAESEARSLRLAMRPGVVM